MRRVLTLALLPVFLFSIVGWQWMFFLKLNSIEEKEWNEAGEMRGLEIVIVSMENPGRNFFINDHELVHDGKLFDVKYKEVAGNSYICHCERDHDEETLLSSLDVQTQNYFDNSHSSKPNSTSVTKISVFETTTIPFELSLSGSMDVILKSTCAPFISPGSIDSFFVPPDVA